MQGPIYPCGLSDCKGELGTLIGDDVLPGFNGLSKTLNWIDRIGRIVLRVDDRRHQLCCQKAVICCDGQTVF